MIRTVRLVSEEKKLCCTSEAGWSADEHASLLSISGDRSRRSAKGPYCSEGSLEGRTHHIASRPPHGHMTAVPGLKIRVSIVRFHPSPSAFIFVCLSIRLGSEAFLNLDSGLYDLVNLERTSWKK